MMRQANAAEINSPCFLVAKFLRNNLPQLQTQSVSYFLRQVRMRTAAEYFDIRHFVVVQGVVQVERAEPANKYEVTGISESKTSTKVVQQLMSCSCELKSVTYPPLCPTHRACRFFLTRVARTLPCTL